MKKVIDVEENLLPIGHQEKIASAKVLAAIMVDQKRLAEAETVLHNAEASGEVVSSVPPLLMVNPRSELAGIFLAQEKHDEAIALYREMLT